MFYNSLRLLNKYYAQFRSEIVNLLDEERSLFANMMVNLRERIEKIHMDGCGVDAQANIKKSEEVECRDVHISCDVDPCPTGEVSS